MLSTNYDDFLDGCDQPTITRTQEFSNEFFSLRDRSYCISFADNSISCRRILMIFRRDAIA